MFCKHFTSQLLQRSQAKVIAFARTLPSPQLELLKEEYPNRLDVLQVDLEDPRTVENAASRIKQQHSKIDLLLNVSGILSDKSHSPERSVHEVDYDWMTKSFKVNTLGHALVTSHLTPLLTRSIKHIGNCSKVINISARVGSIGDNRLGGWYSYRMSKAALNMFTKTASNELKRHHCAVLSLHPGTTDTDLSKPFQKNIKAETMHSAEEGVSKMLDVIWKADMDDTGKFLAYDGSVIEW